MPLWTWILLGLIVILAVRWIPVANALKAQQPNVLGMLKVAQSIGLVRAAIEDLLAHPDMDFEDVQSGWELLTDFQSTVQRAPELGVDSEGIHYVRHWAHYADLGVEMFSDARSWWGESRDLSRFPGYRQRLAELDAKGLEMVAANPTPSFFRMLFTGVPKVKAIN